MASSSFTLDVSKFVEKAKGNINLVQRKIILDMSNRIVMRTPVDTGRARANWMIGIGSPKMQTIFDTDKGVVSQDGVGVSATKNEILEALTGQVIGDKSVFLTNSLVYIKPLEYGHSQQALGGMVRLTVADFAKVSADAVTFARRS